MSLITDEPVTSTTTTEMRRLTQRQRQIVGMIARGMADKEIAAALGIATATAEKHVANVLLRLQVPNRAAAVFKAYVGEPDEEPVLG
ncbi:MAG TPA: helix-turn-helix transcriptional regulator [Candidatus Limnocylindria bacterium]|nr:helix-turn-helix transcriptional regulator [Candidatus Limnocylindria bacterium]